MKSNRTKFFFYACTLSLLFLAGCKEDEIIITLSNPNKDVWDEEILDGSEIRTLQTELRQPCSGGICKPNNLGWTQIIFSDKLRFIFPTKGWLDEKGNAINGDIDIEVYYNNTLGKNILWNKPTQTDSQLLSTGGSYYINFTYKGKPATNNTNYFVDVPISNKKDYSLFSAEQNTNWVEIRDPGTGLIPRPELPVDSFFMLGEIDTMFRVPVKYRYINCDYYLKYNSSSLLNLKVKLPDLFGNKNTSVYVVSKKDKLVFSLFGDVKENLFSTGKIGYNIPIGESFKIVITSKIGTQYYYLEKDITTVKDKIESLQPLVSTKNEIILKLKGI